VAPKGGCRFQQQRGSWKLRGSAIRKLFDLLINGQTPAVNPGARGARAEARLAIRQYAILTEEQGLGVVQLPPAASLYSESLTCGPQAAP
jgi:hypothetical protein